VKDEFALYPNPAKNEINIKGVEKATDFTIILLMEN
jgi:hypothetical protein